MSHEWAKKAVEAKLYSMRDVQKAEKQARAEVLVACLKKLREHEAFVECRKQEHDGIRAGELLIAISAIEQLQPSATALEALLREEREKFAVLQMHIYELLGDLHEMNAPDIADSMGRVETDLKNLEKARASEVKG